MKYKIHITASAEQDLREAVDYIEYALKNRDAAVRLLNLAEERINSLTVNPKLHPLADDPVLKSQGIRFITIKNYLAFYVTDDDTGTIFILRFLFCRRDWISILKAGV